jgi:MFS family permease
MSVSDQTYGVSQATAPPGHIQDRWTAMDWWNVSSFCLGMLLEAFIFGMASLATSWVAMPTTLRSLLLAWAPIWLILGIAVAGPTADRLGRKLTFYSTMTLYGIGAIGIAFSQTYWLILLFLAMLLFAAGGEMNTIMAASHEVMPTRHRSAAMYTQVNFISLGGSILGGLGLVTVASTVNFQRGMIAVTILVVLALLFLARRQTPESIRWLEKRGELERARAEMQRYGGIELWEARRREAEVGSNASRPEGQKVQRNVPLQLYASISMAFANTTGFGILTYVMAPTYFPKLTALLLFVANISGFVTGWFSLWADRMSRKILLLVGFIGAFVFVGMAYLLRTQWAHDLPLFILILVLFYIFVNVSYLSEDTFKGEIWPTERRATYVAIVRFISIGIYIGTIFLIPRFTLDQTILFNVGVWALGLLAAIIWSVWGRETGHGVSVAAASAE